MSDTQKQSIKHPSTSTNISPGLVLVLGGARSGKSTFAERLAVSSGGRVAFIATATPGDEDMLERIARHRASRSPDWLTIEEPLHLAEAVQLAGTKADVLLLDCMTLWLANWMGRQGNMDLEDAPAQNETSTSGVLECIEELLAARIALEAGKTLIVVSNEVGSGIVPAYPLGRIYRDTLGQVNQRLARSADRVYLMIAGLGVDIQRLHEEASL